MDKRVKISHGTVVCVYEPQCRHGLEGYSEGETYRFERWKDHNGTYFKVFPNPDTDYSEVVSGPKIFEKYFSIKEQTWLSSSTSVPN